MKIQKMLILLSLSVAGCGGLSMPSMPSMPWSNKPAPVSDPTAEGYLKQGLAEMKAKRYVRAIDQFQKIKDDFPFSTQSVDAELHIGEAYYLNEQYTEAIRAFQEFQALHPTNENIPFVVYHLGLAHFDQFKSVDRDQKVTEVAKGYFENVIKNYPNSPYVGPAKDKLANCMEYLAEHEFVVASFYLQQEKYPAARERLDSIVRRYPNTPTAGKALYHLGEAYRLEKNSMKAALAYAALVQHYPGHSLAQKAQVQLNEVSQEKQDPLALLLMRDSRPAPTAEQSAEKRPARPDNMVAKKEVVHEEPGADKSLARRVVDKINPFGSSEKNGNQQKEELASNTKPANSSGSIWKGLNPFSSKRQKTGLENEADPSLTTTIDASLKEKGIEPAATLAPPKASLQVPEEPSPSPAETAKLLGDVDARLQREGKNASQVPAPPKPAPAFQSGALAAKPTSKSAVSSAQPTNETSAATAALLGNIDTHLKRRGVEAPKVETPKRPEPSEQPATASTGPEKVELEARLPEEKGTLFLNSGEFQPTEKPAQGETEKPLNTQEITESIVKGPPAVVKKPDEIQPAEKKSETEEPTERGFLDQLKEDVGRIGNILNPFSW